MQPFDYIFFVFVFFHPTSIKCGKAFSPTISGRKEHLTLQSDSDGRPSSRLGMFFADEAEKPNSPEPSNISKELIPVELVASENPSFLNMAGSFLVDSFWLNSEHHQLGKGVVLSQESRINLIVEQCADLQEKYGERMGKRLLDACVLGALEPESKEMLGLVTLKATLLMKTDVLEADKAETIAKSAVALLGPKQRRLYKDASIQKIAKELLPDDSNAVCVLSNLAVSPNARRSGIAQTLCNEAEILASEWGYEKIHLLVESDNTAARKLYEDKLGYSFSFEKKAACGLRADIESGSFTEIEVDTLVLVKNL